MALLYRSKFEGLNVKHGDVNKRAGKQKSAALKSVWPSAPLCDLWHCRATCHFCSSNLPCCDSACCTHIWISSTRPAAARFWTAR